MSNLKTLTTEIVDLVAKAGVGQRDAILKIGSKVEEYVLLYSAKLTEPALIAKARTKAVRILSEDVAKQAPDNSFDLHRSYQMLGVTKVYGDVSRAWSFSVLKEIAPTVEFDGEWKAKHGLDADKIRATVHTLGATPTVVIARQEVSKLLGEMRRKPKQRKADQTAGSTAPANSPSPPAAGPAPMPRIIQGPGTKLQESIRDVAKKLDDLPAKLTEPAGGESPSKISKPEFILAAEAEDIAIQALLTIRHDTKDKAWAFKHVGKNLEPDEIVLIIQGISKHDSSWAALRNACKQEHEARNKGNKS